MLLLGATSAMLGASISRSGKGEEGAVGAASRLAGGSLLLGVIGMYSSAKLLGGELGMTKAFYAMFLATLFAVVIVCVATLGWQSVESTISQSKVVRKMNSALSSTGGHGFVIFMGAPVFVGLLALSFINQRVRVLTHKCGFRSDLPPEATKLLFTSHVSRQLTAMAEWPWVHTLSWMSFWAIAFGWVLSGYVITLAYLVFATLIYLLKFELGLHWAATSLIFFIFGELMFLNPAIPGPAVYLTGGVLLVPAMVEAAEPTGAIVGPLIWATSLCYIMKLVAHIGQQKIFGEGMGSKASVRALVAPNSTNMRAIRYVLEQPGLTAGKVMILCGGPDWPTSVLCGLLGLNLWQMVLGLTPMFFYVAPSVAAGAFQYYGPSWGGSWDSLAAFLLQLVVVLAAILMSFAFYYIEKAVTLHSDELAAYALDEEVDAYEKQQAEKSAAVSRATALVTMPMLPKLWLFGGKTCLLLSAYISMSDQFVSQFAWADFAITEHPYEVWSARAQTTPRHALPPSRPYARSPASPTLRSLPPQPLLTAPGRCSASPPTRVHSRPTSSACAPM